MRQAVETLTPLIGRVGACTAIGVPRSSVYWGLVAHESASQATRRVRPPRSLSAAEQAEVLELLDSERFQDLPPREVYATLLEEGRYACSWRTMYRILRQHDQVRERRDQRCHPAYCKPELLATEPNQVWSWDITKLRGPSKGVYFYLYVLLDIFSRYVVGWMVAECQSADLAQQLIVESCTKQEVPRGQLTLHADNGAAMTAKSVAVLLADLGVVKSHSRPHVSDDNPYSEAQFKTVKYRPDYPDRFGSVADARSWAVSFFGWYNHRHHHSSLALLTPAQVHYGQVEEVLQQRQQVLQQAYGRHPERFVHGGPQAARPPAAAWINPPKREAGQVAEPLEAERCQPSK